MCVHVGWLLSSLKVSTKQEAVDMTWRHTFLFSGYKAPYALVLKRRVHCVCVCEAMEGLFLFSDFI